ncbi:tyrosine--tRNA ligase [candidate division KSB1 bacterium]
MFPPLYEQMDLIRKGTEEIVSEEELAEKITRSIKGNKPLIVKEGFDPTAPDLHLGHMVSVQKLKDFQDLGHTVVFLIGDFTGLVGDPTGRSDKRQAMTEEDVLKNAETYKEQIFKVLDPEKTVIRRNSEWLKHMNLYDFIDLSSVITFYRMLERDEFENRFKNGIDISIMEFIYPLLQGYDSVALKSDVELGGTDQKFNLQVARRTQRKYGLESQVIIMTPILEGIFGKDKMSKSLDNYVGIDEPADVMFEKLLKLPDSLVLSYYTLCGGTSVKELKEIEEFLDETKNFAKARHDLAKKIVTIYYDEKTADRVESQFK